MKIKIIEFLDLKGKIGFTKAKHLTTLFVNGRNLWCITILLNKDTIQKDHTLDQLLVLRQLFMI